MYLNSQQIADKLGKSIHTIHMWGAKGKLPGRKIGGTWLMTTKEFNAFKSGKEVTCEPLYDVRGAADYLGVTIYIVRRLIRKGDLKGKRIDQRGRFGGTLVFSQKELDKLDPDLLENGKAGRKVKGKPDVHINYRHHDSKFVVLGTKNKFGKPFAYTYLFDARGRARKAFGKPPRYWAGDIVDIGLADEIVRAYIVENVTQIDITALVFPMTFPVDEREKKLIPIPMIRKRLVVVQAARRDVPTRIFEEAN